MTDKQLLDMLGLKDRTISIAFDEDYQKILEHKVDDYLKKIDEEKKKEDLINLLKTGKQSFDEKEHLIELLKSRMVINAIKDIMIKEGFSYRCPTCLDVSREYGRPLQTYKHYNK